MSIPMFQRFILPVLQGLADGKPKHWKSLRDHCVRVLELSAEDRAEQLATGGSRLDNRVQWSNTHLYQAGLIERTGRGLVQINDRGREVLADPPNVMSPEYLLRFPEYKYGF